MTNQKIEKRGIARVYDKYANGRVKVLFIFHTLGGGQFLKFLEVKDAIYHFVPRLDPYTRRVIGSDLSIDDGFVELDHPKRMYVARGIPPLVYREESPIEVRWG